MHTTKHAEWCGVALDTKPISAPWGSIDAADLFENGDKAQQHCSPDEVSRQVASSTGRDQARDPSAAPLLGTEARCALLATLLFLGVGGGSFTGEALCSLLLLLRLLC